MGAHEPIVAAAVCTAGTPLRRERARGQRPPAQVPPPRAGACLSVEPLWLGARDLDAPRLALLGFDDPHLEHAVVVACRDIAHVDGLGQGY